MSVKNTYRSEYVIGELNENTSVMFWALTFTVMQCVKSSHHFLSSVFYILSLDLMFSSANLWIFLKALILLIMPYLS